MSSTTSTSASFKAFAPLSLSSRTSSPRRNLYISGHGVGFTTFERIPICPSKRESAVSDPQPSPSALMWVDIATERPARSSCARRSIDSRRCWGTLKRSSTAFRAGELRVRSAVGEVHDQTEHHPYDEPLPGRARETVHHVPADENSQNRDERNERRPERTSQVGLTIAENDDARADDDERQQRPNRDELTQQADRKDSGKEGGDDAGEDRRHVRGLEARVNFAEYGWQQTIARH